MSSGKYASPLQLDLFKSRGLLIKIIVVHLLAFVALFYMALPLLAWAGVGLLLFYNAIRAIYIHASRTSRQAIIRVIWEDNGRWYIVRKSGEKVRVKLLGDTFIHPRLTILNFKVPDKWFSQSVILAADNVNQESHRRLRVRLRTDKPEELYQ